MTNKIVKRTYISIAVSPGTREIEMKKYLKFQGEEKPAIVKALSAFYMTPALLAGDSPNEVEIAKSAVDSIWDLINQAMFIRKALVLQGISTDLVDAVVRTQIPCISHEFNGEDRPQKLQGGSSSMRREYEIDLES